MKFTKTLTVGCCAAALLLAGTAVADEPGKQREGTASDSNVKLSRGIVRSSEVIGMSVKNAKDESIGTVEDVVVDLRSGDIRYAAISFGGFLGFNEKLFAVPWESLDIDVYIKDPDDIARVALYDVTQKDLENAPGFASDNWPDAADPRWGEVDRYYRKNAAGQSSDQTRESTQAGEKTKTGKESSYGSVFRASQIDGLAVKDKQGRELGTVSELVFDLNRAKIRYAAIAYGGFLGVGDKLFAVPMTKLTVAGIGDAPHFVTSIDLETIKNAEGFDQNNWPNTADARWSAGIDEYYGVDAKRNDAKESNKLNK